MSLELALAENTAAIRTLIAAISHGFPATAAQVAAVVKEDAAAPLDAKQGAAATQATAPAADAPEKKAEPSAVTFSTLEKEFLTLVNANRTKALAILAKHKLEKDGKPKLSVATPDQYEAILADIQSA